MGSIIGWLVGKTIFGRTIGEPLARFIATAALVLTIASACTGLVLAYNHHVIAAHDAKQVKKSIPAINQAAAERSADAIANSKHEQEAHDAIAAQPDQPISPTSRALACKRLRDAGRAPPACR